MSASCLLRLSLNRGAGFALSSSPATPMIASSSTASLKHLKTLPGLVSTYYTSSRRIKCINSVNEVNCRYNSSKATQPNKSSSHGHDHEHSHMHHDGHDHSHSGIFHTHAHDHSEGAEQLMQALSKGKLDRGTKITLLGLGSNIALTMSKGAAGLWMNSASLLAEAGHSLSDLLGDLVTLATWRISRRPATDNFPWGYGKFETFGTLSVSVILVGGAIGIGLHSYHLLLQTLLPYLETFPPGTFFNSLAHYLPASVPSPLLELFHSHAILNPHAAWFALGSVVIKEWLYRVTNKVAAQEHSPVLKANALHHRADALTSLVALTSILGSSIGGYHFLDPLGGIAVSFFILQQGLSLSKTAFFELLDAGVDTSTKERYFSIADDLVDGKELLDVRNVRGVKSGGQTVLDLTITVPPTMPVRDSHAVEQRVREAIMKARREVREVKIHVHGLGENEVIGQSGRQPEGTPNGPKSDFGREGC
uniref:Mitochondrial protein with role in iron accumulation n=1 Tax=Kwoniella dejecticola CBS 10117 TaxID=1296121 RepID=A0A1A5ZWA9_9TREE|nr:mitochondrial protein with role in iron accumulation [Kwoniella dejecticola CBS 10117]OBR82089.1 mitochondrial protein with role in iron accumulation [Kwoniella dejecticola CBS 10117]